MPRSFIWWYQLALLFISSILLDAEFVAIVQVLRNYAGAISILMIFGIMMISIEQKRSTHRARFIIRSDLEPSLCLASCSVSLAPSNGLEFSTCCSSLVEALPRQYNEIGKMIFPIHVIPFGALTVTAWSFNWCFCDCQRVIWVV